MLVWSPTFWNFQWLFSTPNCELYCTLSSVQKISYTIKKEEESFRKYKDYETLLNSYSQEENDAKEAHFDYLDRKIEYEKEELNKAEK